jgi:hypothetical protein
MVEEQMKMLALVPIDVKDQIGMENMTYTPHPGSGRLPCEKCGVGCWIGPRQTTMKVNNPEVPAFCMVCAIKECQAQQQKTGEKITASVVPLGD